MLLNRVLSAFLMLFKPKMKLFYLTNTKFGIDNIKKARIKLSKFNEVNDPYEFYVNVTKNCVPAPAEVKRQFRDYYNDKIGFLCLSKRWQNPVLWAHYADKHSGICLGFEVPDDLPMKVRYRKRPPIVDVGSGVADYTDKKMNSFIDATLTKYKSWEYEKEYRLLVEFKGSTITRDNIDGRDLMFKSFGDELNLKQVIAGPKFDITNFPDLKAALAAFSDVQVMKAEISEEKYSVINGWDSWRYPQDL